MFKRPVFYAAAATAVVAMIAASIPAYANDPLQDYACSTGFGTAQSSYTERTYLSRDQINQSFSQFSYSDELVSSTNRVESAFWERLVSWTQISDRYVDPVSGLSDWICRDVPVPGSWQGPYVGGAAALPITGIRDCLKSNEMTLAGPLEPDLTLMPEVTDGFTLDNPALLNRLSAETPYGRDPQNNWRECVARGDAYNEMSPDFLEAEERLANGDIVPLSQRRAERLMAYQGRYKIASEVEMSQVSFRTYPNSFVYGSYSGQTVPLSVDAPASRTTSTTATWFLRDCLNSRTLSGSLVGGERPFALFNPRGSAPLSLAEEAEWMKADCPPLVIDPPVGAGTTVGVMECALVSRENGTTDVIANPIYRSRDAATNAYLGEYRGFTDWIQPTTPNADFQVRANNKFVWADFLRYAEPTLRLGGDAQELDGSAGASMRKWSTFMGLSPRLQQNSPSLLGTLTNGGPGPNDAGQPYHVARQPIDEDGKYVEKVYGQDTAEGERPNAFRNYDRLALNSWYGPTSVLNYDDADSVMLPGFMVAFNAASQPARYWGVQPRWGVSSLIRYTKMAPSEVVSSVNSPSSIVVTPAGSWTGSVTEVLFSDACDATRQARFDVTVPSIVR